VKKSLGDYSGALQAYSDVRTQHPKTDWRARPRAHRGRLQAEGKFKDARDAYGCWFKELPGGFLAAEAQTSIGQCFELEKSPAALKAYEVVLDQYPSAVWDTPRPAWTP